MSEKKQRIHITTSYVPDECPALDAFVKEFKSTGQLSARMRALIELGLRAESEGDPCLVSERLDALAVKLDALSNKLDCASVVLADHDDATSEHNGDEIDISDLGSSVIANLMSMAEED